MNNTLVKRFNVYRKHSNEIPTIHSSLYNSLTIPYNTLHMNAALLSRVLCICVYVYTEEWIVEISLKCFLKTLKHFTRVAITFVGDLVTATFYISINIWIISLMIVTATIDSYAAHKLGKNFELFETGTKKLKNDLTKLKKL